MVVGGALLAVLRKLCAGVESLVAVDISLVSGEFMRTQEMERGVSLRDRVCVD